MSAQEIITIVDSADCVIGSKSRQSMREQGGVYRVTYILVVNEAGELLVQTRTEQKDWCPGKKDLAAGGIVTFDEGYEESAQRELAEELGVRTELQYCFKVYYEDISVIPINRNWGAVFVCQHNGPFKLQPSEVANAVFMPLKAIANLPIDSVTPDTRQVFLSWLMMTQ